MGNVVLAGLETVALAGAIATEISDEVFAHQIRALWDEHR
jgi:hypothetical protein